jgi:hypothetical protein
MNYGKWVLATVVILALGRAGLAADPLKDDPTLTKEQNKRLKELTAILVAPPINPGDQGKYLQTVQNNLDKFLSTKVQPSKQTTNALGTSLVRGLNNGEISVQQTVELSKALAKTLDANVIDYQLTNQLVRSIEPIVSQTGLNANAKTQFYADVLRVIKTAPTYAPR